MTIKTRNFAIYQTLIAQLNKTARHNRQGSFRTKERYYEAMKRFCRFLSEEYRLQKLANISGKHLTAYVLYMQERGKSASTIKTDLAGIRFFHDKMERTKYRLPSNDELAVELERRRFGGVDRTWSVQEFHRFLATCLADNHEDFATIACLTWYAGLRIHECFRMDTATAAKAFREGVLTIKGKGGLVRTVPLNDVLRERLNRHLAATPRGHKLFIPDGVPTHKAVKDFQAFLAANRLYAQDAGSDRPMTFHGLRHTRAAEWYVEFVKQGQTPYQARKAISKLLGYGRDDVTRIYLASLDKGDCADGK